MTDYFYPSGGDGTPGVAPGTAAAQIAFTPYGNLQAVNVQAAIQELVDEAEYAKVVFGETMATNTPFKIVSGKAYKITSLDGTAPVVHGVTLESGNNNDTRLVAMAVGGKFTTPLAFGSTGAHYLAQAGGVTTTPPSHGAGDLWNVPVFYADTTTTFVLNPRRPIRLS